MSRIAICLLIFCISLTGCTSTQSSSSNAEIKVDANQALDAFLESDWSRIMQQFPEYASYLGVADDQQNSSWTDNSLQAYEERHLADKAALTKLLEIDRSQLSEQQKTNYDLYQWQLEMEIKSYAFKTFLMPVSQRDGIQTLNNFINYAPLNTLKDYQNWLARLDALPQLIDQTRQLMEVGIKENIVPPIKTLSRVTGQFERHLVDDPKDSLFYVPFETLPDTFTDEQKAQLQSRASFIIKEKLLPKYQDFNAFLINQYLPACRQDDGVWALANGKAYYEYLVDYFTTTDMTPDEIHQLGLQEVARNRAEMDKVIEEVGFEGSFEEFLHFLRTDPQFYYETPEALYEGYLAVSKRLDPELTKLFGKLPRMPYGVKAIPDNVAPQTTTAYYSPPSADGMRPGYYYVNLYQPESRPKYEMEVLSVHEAVPGHHLQIALQSELGELPPFRRFLGFTVFIEGWGLYSERLGYDMGLYQDPYSRFGQLTYDMWRSVRLVVDTGIHYMGWTRQQAIDYFKANAAKTEQDIINEIDRYITNPGQALAYKIGQLKMLELREKAKQALGDKFDIRAFHDAMLGSGSVPLNVLEETINQWIADNK
ncbi:DUF885 domain-containing protein [Glaciecola sp. 1036]|uniref:DUF885 domain-containing protein n=1 Tax=Alteromonadaceae TaxID=72275 RepID=UPI003D066723